MKKVIIGFVILLVFCGCEQKAGVSNIEEVKQLTDYTSDIIEEYSQDSVVDKTIKDGFNYIHFIERIKQISEVDTFSKTNKNVKSLLLKGEYDSSTYYIIKVGVDTKYRFQTVYNFYVDSITHKLFFLDVFNNSLIEIKNGVRLLPKSRIMSGY
jgi:hypothetical protein